MKSGQQAVVRKRVMRDDGKPSDAERDYGNRADDGIKVTTALGTVQAHGPMVIAVILLVCAVGVIAFMQRDHDIRTQDTMRQMADLRSSQMVTVQEQQARIEKKMDNLTYATLLPENQKAGLRLDMPPDLRLQLLNQERRR